MFANVSLACGGGHGARQCLPVAELTPALVSSWWASADTRIFDPRDVRNRRCANCSAADQSALLQSAPGVKSCSRSTERQEAFVLRLASALGVADAGTFLEVGGHDGLHASNTVFSQLCRQWRGLMIEANPASFKVLRRRRAGVIAVRTALCANAGSVEFVTRDAQFKGSDSDEMGGVASTVDTAAYDAWKRKLDARRKQAGKKTVADPFVRYAVPCMRLAALLTTLRVPRVDIMWLDVEGSELSVLQSIDFSSISVGLLVVELRVGNAHFNVQVRSLLRKAGYELVRTMKARAQLHALAPGAQLRTQRRVGCGMRHASSLSCQVDPETVRCPMHTRRCGPRRCTTMSSCAPSISYKGLVWIGVRCRTQRSDCSSSRMPTARRWVPFIRRTRPVAGQAQRLTCSTASRMNALQCRIPRKRANGVNWSGSLLTPRRPWHHAASTQHSMCGVRVTPNGPARGREVPVECLHRRRRRR